MIANWKIELITELHSILEYWKTYAVDNTNGGFYGQVGIDNKAIIDASKGGVLNARILWSFSAAFQYTNIASDLEMSERAYNYLKDNFKDETYGGIFWELDAIGNKLNGRKQIYAQAFLMYSLVEYYKATKEEEALNWAIELFHLIEEHALDKVFGGYIEAFAEDWSEIDDVRLSTKDSNERKTANTHLHVLEAYTSLFSVWKDTRIKVSLNELIKQFKENLLSPNFHLNLFLNMQWKVKDGAISFGHDIEASWLLYEAAIVMNDEEQIADITNLSVKIAAETESVGMGKLGSVINHKSATGELDEQIEWWIPAEAMVGFYNAWKLSGEDKFLRACKSNWDFIRKYVIDEVGEWHWYIDKNGHSSGEEKIGFWKCPYHNTRACLELIKRIG
jgi:mannobiose 2-epimerase